MWRWLPNSWNKSKRKERRLLGFGHRVYKSYDPRARLVRNILHRIFQVCGQEPLMHVAEALERQALYDDYFIQRRLYPNVDFYTGLCYKAMGFPSDFFPLLFAVPRIVGWLAHWREQLADTAASRIWRPRQWYDISFRIFRYVGPKEEQPYTPMDKRTNEDYNKRPSRSNSQAMYKRYSISRYYQTGQSHFRASPDLPSATVEKGKKGEGV